jgi:Tfp pilus assembly protein PilF
MARALAKLGRANEANNWLDKAVQSNPQNYRAWYQIGLLADDPVTAQSAYEKATMIQPNFPPGQRELGMLLFQQKNYAAAALRLEKAIALGLEDAPLRNFLGICYSRTNHLEKAILSYQAALKLDPKLADGHLNLAYALQRIGKLRQAQLEYAAACKFESKYCELVPKSKP